MADRLMIWSDIPGDWFHASSESDAESQKKYSSRQGDSVRIERVDSFNDLIRLFKTLNSQGTSWDSVNFHTHGNGGSIALGSNNLNLTTVERLDLENFNGLFKRNCEIVFDGCNVAEGAHGEFFLVKIGNALLATAGGRVKGNTGAGFGNWGSSTSVHPVGDWITATVTSGGSIKFDKLYFLDENLIKKRIRDADQEISRLRSAFRGPEETEARKALQNAKNFGTGRWTARYWACLWLEDVDELLIRTAARSAASNPAYTRVR